MKIYTNHKLRFSMLALLLSFAMAGQLTFTTFPASISAAPRPAAPPALQGAAAIAQLKERGLYDSLRAGLSARGSRGGDYSLGAPALPDEQKLTASDGAGSDEFGYSVAVSGTTIVVGAEEDDVGVPSDHGSAYVFERQGGSWVQTQHLTASDRAAGDRFGFSVAVSGSTIVVGARRDNIGVNPDQGSAYVFAP